MKLKSIVAGDIVKVVPDEAFGKVCEFLGVDASKQKNEFEVRYVDYDEKSVSEVWYAIIPKDVDISETKVVGLKKKRLEVIEPTNVQISYNDSFRDMLSFNSTGKKIYKAIQDANIREIEKDYFSVELIDGEYMVTYIPFEKNRFMDNNYYDADLRKKYATKIKPIKIIQEIIKVCKPDFEMTQDIVDGLLACINKDVDATFVIVKGADISKYYSETHYASLDGTLGNSCMRYHKLSQAGVFYLYEDYAEMVILKDNHDDKILGRALLWTLHGEKEFEGKKLLDRIYTINDAMVGLFEKFAEQNGFYHLKRQTFGTSTFVLNGEIVEMSGKDVYVNVSDKINKYMFHPYIDTFQIKFKSHLDRLYMRCLENKRGIVAYHNYTGGSRDVTDTGYDMGLRKGGNV